MAQIRQVVSETLQATVRRLLPSQQGFTEDLQASNVIMPVIDLTPAAEGSSVPSFLQRAYSFDDITAFSATNQTTTVLNSTGFWQVTYGVTLRNANSGVTWTLSDGLSNKIFKGLTYSVTGNNSASTQWDEFVIFMSAGETLTVTSAEAGSIVQGSYRQIADVGGNLVNPTNFVPQ